jgi:hypothetical protein
MRPVFNLETKYTVTRDEWARGTGTLPAGKGSSASQMGPGLRRGLGLGSMGNLWEGGSASL